jgi:hypothetical protein
MPGHHSAALRGCHVLLPVVAADHKILLRPADRRARHQDNRDLRRNEGRRVRQEAVGRRVLLRNSRDLRPNEASRVRREAAANRVLRPPSPAMDRVTVVVLKAVGLPAAGQVTSAEVGRLTSTVGLPAVDRVTSVAPTATTGTPRGIRMTTIGTGAITVLHGATVPHRGVGVRRHPRRGSGRCHLRGDRLRRRSTTGATRSSHSGTPATTNGASTSSGSGFRSRSDPG